MQNKRRLSRLHLPRPLVDLIMAVAAEKGFTPDETDHFLYELLMKSYPGIVKEWEKMNAVKADWLARYKLGDEKNGDS
jgi:hypothetical protein